MGSWQRLQGLRSEVVGDGPDCARQLFRDGRIISIIAHIRSTFIHCLAWLLARYPMEWNGNWNVVLSRARSACPHVTLIASLRPD
jgi:hypothetical protein